MFPAVPDVPVDTYRTALYHRRRALRGSRVRVRRGAGRPGLRLVAASPSDPERALAKALHDHAIDEALDGGPRAADSWG